MPEFAFTADFSSGHFRKKRQPANEQDTVLMGCLIENHGLARTIAIIFSPNRPEETNFLDNVSRKSIFPAFYP